MAVGASHGTVLGVCSFRAEGKKVARQVDPFRDGYVKA